MATKRLTLEDIGKLAGVSRATVSRVINDHPNISDEVRERVERVIDETGYQPNRAARQLASNRSNIIGLVIPSTVQALFVDPYFPMLIQGIAQACNTNDYTLSLFLFHTLEEERQTVQRLLGTGLVDGLLISADSHDKSFLPRLQERGIPFVLIGHFANVSDVTYIDADNVGGAYTATKHLIDCGHKRVAIIGAEKNAAAYDRLRGYKQALEEANLVIDDNLIIKSDFTQSGGYIAMKQLLSYQPDAVFTASDAMGAGAVQAIQEAGLSVPEDISVIGFDDLPPALSITPHLSTIRQPVKEMGALAVETLIEILENPNDAARQIILPTELIIRQSCGTLSYP